MLENNNYLENYTFKFIKLNNEVLQHCFIHPSNYWVFKNASFQSFFVRIMDLKKKCQDVSLRKKFSAFRKKYYFFVRNARKYSKSKIDFKNLFLRVFRHFDSQFYIFFKKLRLFYIKNVIFRLGFARVHNDFFLKTISANFC